MSAPAIMRLQLGRTQALVTSPTGASHSEKGLPCQDACMVSQQFYRGQPYMVLAVADGHGCDKYTRSEIGAHLAMEAVHQAATDLMMSLVALQKTDEKNWHLLARNDIDNRFYRNISRYWRELVTDHAKEYPEPNIIADSDASISRYGTTVLAAIYCENYLILASLGDSVIFIAHMQDNKLEIIPKFHTEPKMDSSTDSMISQHVVHRWRTQAIPLDKEPNIKMLILTSDGMPDSLTDPKKSVQSIYEQTKAQGIDWLQSVLPRQLAQWSKDGVGDDMGMVLLFPNFSQTTSTNTSTPDQTKESTS